MGGARLVSSAPASQAVDAGLGQRQVLELGGRADLIGGELDELVAGRIAPARVADQDVDPAVADPAAATA